MLFVALRGIRTIMLVSLSVSSCGGEILKISEDQDAGASRDSGPTERDADAGRATPKGPICHETLDDPGYLSPSYVPEPHEYLRVKSIVVDPSGAPCGAYRVREDPTPRGFMHTLSLLQDGRVVSTTPEYHRNTDVDYRTTFAFVFPGYLTMNVGAKEGTSCSITDIGERLLQNGKAEIYLDR